MAVGTFVFNVAKVKFANGTLDFDTDVIKVTLFDSDFAFPFTLDAFKDKATVAAILTTPGWEAAGGTYTNGPGGTIRLTLAGVSVAQDDINNRAKLIANDVEWAGDAGGINVGTVNGALVYKHVSGTDDTLNFPIAWYDDGGFPIATNGGSLKIKWAENTGTAGIVVALT